LQYTGRLTTIRRPVQKLIPLEIKRITYLTQPEEDDLDETDDPVTKSKLDCNVRPTRKAAQEGEALRRIWDKFA